MKAIQNQEEYKQVIDQDKPVLLDFYADWCGPCQALLPIVDELAEKYGDDVEIRKVNIDENQELAQQYGVRSIPALFFIQNGEVVDHLTGYQPGGKLEEKIKNLKTIT